MRLFTSGLRKLARRPATYVIFGLLAGLMALIILASATTGGQGGGDGPGGDPLALVTFPGAYTQLLSFTIGLGGLFAVIYGATIAGSEWSWGTLKAAVTRGESRSLYILATFAAIPVVVAVGLLGAYIIAVGTSAVGALIAGVSLDGIGSTDTLSLLPDYFARGWVGIAAQAALGFAVATLARSQLAGIAAGIGVYFAGTFAGVFLPDITQYLPFQLATTAIGDAGFGNVAASLSPDTALLLLGTWLIGALAVAAGFTQRAEITG
jgi:ABC-type transport system involved in multi-copper enzyme maturation permease subunit